MSRSATLYIFLNEQAGNKDFLFYKKTKKLMAKQVTRNPEDI